jgi:hypothetical protein
MIRAVLAATLALGACGRGQGVDDRDLGGLVIAPKSAQAIVLDRAVKDPAELARALAQPHHTWGLGPHTVAISTASTVEEAGKPVESLSDHTTLELGDQGAFHAIYTNSADYGREVVFAKGMLFLRPRYQKWHQRTPETPDEPAQIADELDGAVAATWDLLAPAVELTDQGAVQVGGRAGRKIAVKQTPSPRPNPKEPLAQRAWREQRTIDGVTGEIVLDADKGVPLHVSLSGNVGFTRDHRQFTMKLSVQSDVSGIGTTTTITAPAGDDVVATPERLREVDDRDFLLQGIAPPLRKNADGSPVAPAPAAAGSGSNSQKP